MPKLYQFAILFSFVAIVLFLIHLFLLWTIFSNILPVLGENMQITKISFSCVFLLYLGFAIFKFIIPKFWPQFYLSVTLYLGYILLCFLNCFIYHFINLWYDKITVKIWLIFIFGSSLLEYIYGIFNANNTKIDRLQVKIKNLKKTVKIAHLSDLHLGVVYQRKFIEKVAQIVSELKPDFCIITGDIADGNLNISSEMITPLENLGFPVYYITGNHDTYAGISHVLSELGKTKLTHIENQVIDFNGILNIVGIDFQENKNTILTKLNLLYPQYQNSKNPNILLYHVPNAKIRDLEKYKIDLFLAGHTHAGQIPPFQIPSYFANEYFAGFYQENNYNCKVYVSTGVGSAGPPMRIFSHSVIGLLTLIPDN